MANNKNNKNNKGKNNKDLKPQKAVNKANAEVEEKSKDVEEVIEKISWKPYIIMFIVAIIFGAIMINGMYFGGYYSAEYPYEGGIIAAQVGYEQADNNFTLSSGDEFPYIQVPTTEAGKCDKMIISFSTKAEEDIDLTVLYIDDAGNQLENVSEGVWEKGNYYAIIDVDNVVCNSYCISIPTDFTFNSIYYGIKNDPAGNAPVKYMAVWALIALVLVLIARFTPIIKCVSYLTKKCDDCIKKLKKSGTSIIKTCVFILGGIALSEIVGAIIIAAKGDKFSSKIGITAAFLGLAVGVIVRFYKEYEEKAAIIMGVVIFATGSIIAFTTPANVGVSWDDETHFINASDLSHFFDCKRSAYDSHMIAHYVEYAQDKVGYTKREQEINYQMMDVIEENEFYEEIDRIELKPIKLAYLPSAIGFGFARGLKLPYNIAFCVGRWMNVWLLAICCILAMKRLKTGKIVVMMVALFPTNIYVAGNYTYDTWLLAFTIYGLSAFFSEFQTPNEKITVGRMLKIAIPMFLAVQPKLVYFPLTLICLFLPRKKFESLKHCWFYRLLILAAAFIPFIMVYMMSFGSSTGEGVEDVRGGEGVNSYEQMQLIKTKPKFYVEVMFNFLKNYFAPSWFIPQGLENLAYVGYSNFSYIYFLVTVPLFCLLDHEGTDEDYFPWWSKIGAIVVLITIGLAAATSMYVAYTAVGADGVAGCQARYLLPAVFPFLYILSRWRWKDKIKSKVRGVNISIACAICMLIPLIMTIYSGCLSLYMKG